MRLKNLIEHFTLYLYQNICRSLFENHKPLFAFLMALRILRYDNAINVKEMRYLLVGTSLMSAPQPNPCPDWLDEKSWKYLCELETVSSPF